MCNLVKQDTDIDVENITREEIVRVIKEKNLVTEKQNEGLNIDGVTKGELIVNLFEAYSENNLIQPTFVIDFSKESSPL